MKKYIESPLWGVLGTIGTILALIAAVYFYDQQRQVTELSYEIVAESSLLTDIGRNYEDQIQVFYEGDEVTDIQLHIIRIANTGNQPIKIPAASSQYERSINISFGDDARILAPNIVNVSPNNLHVTTSMENNKIVVDPILLNPNNEFTLEILVGGGETAKVDWWLENVESVKEIQKNESLNKWQLVLAGLVGLGVSRVVDWVSWFRERNKRLRN